MAIINLYDNTIKVWNDKEQDSIVSVLPNKDTGFFYVGNVFTPKDLVGKKLRLTFEIVEE